LGAITPDESRAVMDLEGSDYIGDLQGEYIIESYGIAQDLINNENAGSSVVIEIADTTGFSIDDDVQIHDDNNSEVAVITNVVLNSSITVDTLTNSYTTLANAYVIVGEVGSAIVDDLVTKYATALTRTGIQTSSTKFIVLFKGTTAYDAIVKIADTEGYVFGHDDSLDFFYNPRTFEDSGLTVDLDIDDVIDYSFPRPGYDIINRVDVYGNTVGGSQVSIRVEELESQEYYGIVRGETIIDETIATQTQAYDAAQVILSEKAWVIQTGELSLLGYETLKSGQLITLANFESVTDGQFLVTEVRRVLPENIAYVKIAQYSKLLEDVLVDLIIAMREQSSASIDEDAIQTKFLNFYEIETHTIEIVNITQININDGYIAGHGTNSICGRGYNGVGGTQIKAGRYFTDTVIV
jgi:hypothetical protein